MQLINVLQASGKDQNQERLDIAQLQEISKRSIDQIAASRVRHADSVPLAGG